jgi:uncharacterized protein
MAHYFWLIPLGFVIGAYGTLIGAGGGFVLVPLLLLLYPNESPDLITSISLAVVFFNAFSGSLAYARMKRVDYRSGIIFSIATVPGAILGALTTSYISRGLFDAIFGTLMIVVSAYLLWRPGDHRNNLSTTANRNQLTTSLVDREGVRHTFSYNPVVGIVLSLFVGYVSSLLGVGGGFIHVPALVHLLSFPVHVATATSHFVLAVMALTGTIVHVVTGTFAHGVSRTIALGVGAIFGAQLGALLSNRLHGDWIIRGLAVALGLVGIRLLIMAL